MLPKWQKTTLGEVITLKRGYDLSAKNRKQGRVPVITSSGISGYHSEAKIKGPGVITGRYGNIGSIFFCETDYWPHNTTLYVKDFKNNYPQFIYYLLHTINFESYNDKAAVPGINRNHLHMAEVEIPDFYTQKEIANILSSFDNKIELNRKMNVTLEQIAQTIFKSWFVDFDPVKAKAAGREPEGMDAETAALFPSEFEQSELGMIPKGWEIGSFAQMFNFTMGQSPPGETYNENREGIVFYQGRADFGFRYPTPRIYCFAPMRFAQEGETLLSVRAPVGDINMSMERCCIGRGLASIIHKTGSCSYTFYKMRYLEKELASFNGEGTVFGSISKTTLSEIKIKEPSTR